jgi:hypothetical protein
VVSVAMIYVRSFINTGSGIQNVLGGIQTHRQEGWISHKPTLGKQAKHGDISVTHTNVLLFHSQHVSAQIDHHEIIREKYTSDGIMDNIASVNLKMCQLY